MFEEFSQFLEQPKTILDVGSGSCHVSELLLDKGYDVTSLDVANFSLVAGLEPMTYDGFNMPFGDQKFDLALVLFTLHHTLDPERVLAETARVARRIIVMEDIVRNRVHQVATWGMDSLLNLEFFGQAHNNKSDQCWRDLFDLLGLRESGVRQRWAYGIMCQRTYSLDQKQTIRVI
jgi:ubiquinone/menaquinone biosynthesis C-methylase UbiE